MFKKCQLHPTFPEITYRSAEDINFMSLCITFFLQSCVFCENLHGKVSDGVFWHELSVKSTQGCVGVHRSLHLGSPPSVSQRLSSFKRHHSLPYHIIENEYKGLQRRVNREGEEAVDLTSSPDTMTQHPIGGSGRNNMSLRPSWAS